MKRISDIEVRRLGELLAEGKSLNQCAHVLARDKNALRRAAAREGFAYRKRTKLSQAQIERICAEYPNMRAADLAAAMGLSLFSVYNAANRFGLRKSEAFKVSDLSARIQRGNQSPAMIATRFKKGQVPPNKGLRRPGWAPGRMAETQFKKGRPASEARNYVPIGTEKIDPKRGVLVRKITDDPAVFPAQRWRPVHVLVWMAANGTIPPGHICIFKPGRKTFVATEITLDRLELVTYRENMRRNTVHNLPKPLANLVQLRGALNRKINKRLRQHEEQDGRPA